MKVARYEVPGHTRKAGPIRRMVSDFARWTNDRLSQR
jgi:hypothetical protein